MENKIDNGKFVAYTYRLHDNKTGELLFEAKEDAPDTMIYGLSNDVIPGLLVAIKGLAKGDRFSVTLPPEAAFGERFPDNVITLDKEIFMRDGKLVDAVQVDAELPMMTQEGFYVKGRVLEITDKNVKMDFNHPFAGKEVKFDGEIREVRDATPEEINKLQQNSCGCGGGCCGGCDSEGESDCGCGDHHCH